MYIDRNQTVFFVHIPKNAGTAISGALKDLKGPPHPAVHPRTKHETLPEFVRRRGSKSMRRWLGLHLPESSPFSFAVVRQPWERMVSFYSYLKKTKSRRGEVAAWQGFPDFVRDIENRNAWLCSRYSMKPQVSYVSDGGRPMVDYLCSFSRLADDLDQVSEAAGIPLTPERRNTSDHGSYQQYYDDHSRAVVAEYFKDDIDYFGYRIDSLEPTRHVGWCAGLEA